MSMHYLAFDIGGANIKVADGQGFVATYPFAMWRDSARLAQELRTIISGAPPCNHLAITMTGELADCFNNKREGVQYILQALQDASDNRHTRVYLCDGRMVTPRVAEEYPHLAAASNWHVLAQYATRFVPREPALLIDIGSTTTDLIPIARGKVVSQGLTDTTRLLASELVYTGVERSPICGLVSDVPYRGGRCPVTQEWFATTYDIYLLLEQVPENAHDIRTADGRPAIKSAARMRMGRMIGADQEEFNHKDAVDMAAAVAEAQISRIVKAAKAVSERLPSPPECYIISGQGEFLARKVVEDLPPVARVFKFSREHGSMISRCAPAYALAVLAREAHGV